MMRATAVILAGGKSRRMGRDKALLRLGGERMVDRAAARLRLLFPEILVAVGSRELPPPPGARSVRDRRPGRGPLAGIHAALSEARYPLAFVTACDAPHLRPALVRALRHRLGKRPGIVPASPRGPEPLCGFYRRSLLPDIARRLRRGQLSLQDLIRGSGIRVLPWSAVHRHDPRGESFVNANTPGEFRKLRARRRA